MQLITLAQIRWTAAPIYSAGTRHYNLCECWATIVRSGVGYELTRMTRLNNADRVRDILYIAVNMLNCQKVIQHRREHSVLLKPTIYCKHLCEQ